MMPAPPTREEDGKVVFRGEYAACTQQEMLDMSVLGRDILDLSAVAVNPFAGMGIKKMKLKRFLN